MNNYNEPPIWLEYIENFMTKFAALQVVATLALAAAVEQLNAHNYLVAMGLAIVGGGCYIVYELIPVKPS